MWASITAGLIKAFNAILEGIKVAGAFFAGKLMEQLKQLERQHEADKKIIKADNDVNSLDDDSVRDRLRNNATIHGGQK